MKNLKRIGLIALVLMLCMGVLGSALAEMVLTTASVNVRKGAGTNYGVIGTASKDRMYIYQGESKKDSNGVNWYKVEYGAFNYGWISSKYAKMITDPAKMPTGTLTAVSGKTYIRAGAGLGEYAKGTLQQGATAAYLGDSVYDERGVEWHYVRSQGILGWISEKYTVFGGGSTPSPSPDPAPGKTRYVTISGAQTNLRSQPSLSGKQLKVMHDGDSATYLESSAKDDRGVTWYKVKFNGTTGWVSSKYTKLSSKPTPTPSGSKYVTVYGAQTYLRSQPSLSGKQLKVLHEGEYADYLNKKEYDDRGVAWYKVKFNGTTGWVSSKYTVIE